MSKSSKSVNFEDYRDHLSWQDECSGVNREKGERYPKNSNDIPSDKLSQRYNSTAANGDFNEFPNLPPPLESKDRLVQCIDPVSADLTVIPHWYNPSIIKPKEERSNEKMSVPSSYIMPSSLAPPVTQHESNTIPPPTAFRDEVSRFKNLYHQCTMYNYDSNGQGQRSGDDGGHGGTNTPCDIIEIKRPGTVCLRRDESNYGLAYQYQPSSRNWQQQTVSNERTYLRNGLFNLPEVYCPPPLGPVYHQSPPNFVLSPRSSQLQGLMPSFFTKPAVSNPLSSNSQYEFTILKSPRQAYSEPILKPSSFERCSLLQQHRPETGRFPVKANNKPFHFPNFNKTDSDQKSDENHHHVCMQNQNLQTDDNDDYKPESRSTFRTTNDGSGDKNDTQVVSNKVKFSTHNCLSPRAKLSHLQPSVITPLLTESLLQECLSSLRSPHWEDNFEAFSQIYNLTELHPGRVRSILNKVIWHGLPHLSSPRTKLARMACICFKRLYQTQKRSMETEGERVFYRLLDLCGGLANNFIQQESREALVAAVENMDPLKSLSFLELHGAKHKNPHVREFSAYLLSTIMDVLPQTKLMNKEFSPRIIPMIVSFLREGLLQTRLHAKLALDKIFDHPSFESKLKRYVSPENVRHITDTLREFRERRSGHL